MNLHETVLRMRELLLAKGVKLSPDQLPALAQAWIDEVEASPAFAVPMTRHQAERFSFVVDGIG